ncbi:hypothetical protein QYH69_33980 [Paraburkholderia sp. SARCC-3016]|uniref:hypothetical protein n=1 Tax=Paraburkholderia sp. SARCC-3016 TaxID=3058611 RepID=UPI002809E975|nr:hypothetical protein [Paraburkholderia sp. SARCC-3016]MDQ7982235.1 hypothetical protein [Paraburkholderia sp. SARCC-3016]
MYELTSLIRNLAKPKAPTPTLDDVTVIDEDAQNYALTNIAINVAAALQEWADAGDSDLDDGETLATRLLGLFIGLSNPDVDDEELTGDEQETMDLALESAWDYLTDKGVSEDDASALLNDWDNDAAVRIRDLLAATLTEVDPVEDIDGFAFDGAGTFDAVYRMKTAIRDGKKVRVNKRVSGKVKLTAKQKLALRKASKKAHTAAATMKRVKSQRKSAAL